MNSDPTENDSGVFQKYTPWKGLLAIIALTVLSEFVIHLAAERLVANGPVIEAFADAAALGVVVFGICYFFVVRPLVLMTQSFRQNERRLYNYARTASDWFWGLGPDLRFTYLSDTFEAATGRSRDTVLGKTWAEIGVTVEKGLFESFLADVRNHKPFRNFEHVWRETSGDSQWFSVTGQPLFSEDGAFTGYFGTGNDITLDRYAERELKSSKSLVDGILRTSLDGFMVLSAVHNHRGNIVDFRFVHANNKAGEIVGRNRQDLLGKLFRREIPRMDEGGLLDHAIATTETGRPFDIERFFDHENVKGWFRIIGVKLDDGVVVTFSDITSLKMAEKSLLDAIESIPEGFVLWDTNGRLIVCNSNFREFYSAIGDAIRPGESFETLMRTAAERGHLVMSGSVDAWLAERVATFRSPTGPHEQQLKNGRWLKVNNHHTTDGRTVSIHSDITGLKHREQALVESQARLEEAQRIGHLGWWSLDVDDEALQCSNEVYHILGVDPTEVRPTFDTMIDAVHPNDRDRFRGAIRAALTHQQPLNLEHRILRPNGTQRVVQVKGEARNDAMGGGMVRVIATVLDITERKAIEEELRRSEERYTLAVTGSNEGIWDWDMTNDKFYMSPRFKEILGFDPTDLDFSRDELTARIDPPHMEKYTSRLNNHLSGDEPFFSCEYRIKGKNGEPLWILERGLAIRDETGRPCRMAGSITDVSERRAAEDRLMHTQKMEALGQLAGGVAHEFNNLLTGISGFARMAQKKPNDVERVKNCLEEVIASADRSAEITRQLLRFSRREDANPQVVYPSTVITGMKKMLEPLLGPKVALKIVNDNPGACCRIDPGQLSQVVMNLAVNGRDAMPNGGPLIIGSKVVDVNRERDQSAGNTPNGTYLCVYVQDHGTGIEEKVLKRIFEPFYSTKEQGKGTGLGLSITYGIVNGAGGFIDIASTVGEGTTFSIYFPLATSDETTVDTVKNVTQTLPGRGEVILLVDDERAVRGWVEAVLIELGYKVLTAINGVDGMAKQKAYKDAIDLLLTDVIMPEMGGVELAQRFFEVRPETKVIFMSGYTNRDTERAAPEIPADALLLKPFTQEKLAAFVRNTLDA
ncbi:MAG: PAS domain-containing protein [Alphaproteobacteria bacterium]|nr:PAS domain-containing protein [Alphaproteobacteria bacterium]